VNEGQNKMPKLPSGWVWINLGAIAEIQLGKMLSPKAYENGLIQLPYLRNENVRWGTIDTRDVKKMGFKEQELKRYGVKPFDLLVCEGGEAGRCAVYRGATGKLMYQKAIHRIRFFSELTEPYFVAFCLRYFISSGTVIPKPSETTIQHLPLEKIKSVPIPLPPLAEQRRIVAKIEELFTKLDAGVAALKTAQAQLKRYRQAVLKAAVEGELTREWREQHKDELEPASVLLEHLLRERRAKWEADQVTKMHAQGKLPKDDKWKAKYQEPVAPDSTYPLPVPKGWELVSLESLTSAVRVICYGILMPKENVSDGVLFVKVKDMRGDKIDLPNLHRTSFEIASQYARASLKAGDLLLAIRGTYGRVAEVPPELEGGNITQDTARLEVSGFLNPKFIATFLRSPDAQNYFKRVARGVAVKGVNISEVRTTPILVPSLTEQEQIVSEVERRLSIADEIGVSLTAELKRAERLRQAILKRAFEGKLVPQDPSDEPASVLLERVRQARDMQAATTASNGKRAQRTRKSSESLPFNGNE
jgi:type I restriction enzyme, S subunit